MNAQRNVNSPIITAAAGRRNTPSISSKFGQTSGGELISSSLQAPGEITLEAAGSFQDCHKPFIPKREDKVKRYEAEILHVWSTRPIQILKDTY